MTDVRIILDTSAILAYAAGSIHVGEVITEVSEESARFAVPLVCLIEATRRVGIENLPGVYLLVS